MKSLCTLHFLVPFTLINKYLISSTCFLLICSEPVILTMKKTLYQEENGYIYTLKDVCNVCDVIIILERYKYN